MPAVKGGVRGFGGVQSAGRGFFHVDGREFEGVATGAVDDEDCEHSVVPTLQGSGERGGVDGGVA